MTSNMAFYGAAIFSDISPDQCQIFTLCCFIKKLLGQMGHGFFSFGNNQKARGVFIYTVNQTRSITTIIWEVIKVIHQRINQSPWIIAMARMYNPTRGFIDNK